MYFLLPALSFVLTLVLLEAFLRTNVLAQIRDVPNQRSLHVRPVPRVGGLALMMGAVAVCAFQPLWEFRFLLVPILLLIAVSLVDDVRGLSARWRLLVHIVAATLFAVNALLPAFGVVAAILAALAIVWMTNLYNFMDGSDGLAGGMALIGFATYGVAGLISRDVPFALLNFAIASAALAFLFYNFNPARVFMGDVGSIPLGFLAGAIGTLGWIKAYWPVWFPFLVFSPFVMDASITLVKRLARGDKVWQAHKEHFYQRLVQLGFGHKKTALMEYAAMLIAGAAALWGRQQNLNGQVLLVLAALGVYAGLGVHIERKWQRATEKI